MFVNRPHSKLDHRARTIGKGRNTSFAEDLVYVNCKEAKHLNVGAIGLQGTPLMISRGSVFVSEIMAVAATARIPCFFRTPTAPKHMFYEQSHKLCSPRATRFKSGRRLACTLQPITYQAASDSSELLNKLSFGPRLN
jgi:hypothetical protein